MGWNSWNQFGCDINEEVIRQTARAMADSGMRDAGYEYVVIDDCWQARAKLPVLWLLPLLRELGQSLPHLIRVGVAQLVEDVHQHGLTHGSPPRSR